MSACSVLQSAERVRASSEEQACQMFAPTHIHTSFVNAARSCPADCSFCFKVTDVKLKNKMYVPVVTFCQKVCTGALRISLCLMKQLGIETGTHEHEMFSYFRSFTLHAYPFLSSLLSLSLSISPSPFSSHPLSLLSPLTLSLLLSPLTLSSLSLLSPYLSLLSPLTLSLSLLLSPYLSLLSPLTLSSLLSLTLSISLSSLAQPYLSLLSPSPYRSLLSPPLFLILPLSPDLAQYFPG